MRRKSYGTYVKAVEADQQEKREQEAQIEKGVKKAKTFGEIMKQRLDLALKTSV